MNNIITLIREIENPLFYICSVDVKDECKFGNRIHKIFIKKGDIVPNFYKSTCHMIEKRGQSKGKLLGIAFYPANFNTGPHYLTTLTLEELKERLI